MHKLKKCIHSKEQWKMHLFHSETVVKTKCKKIFVLPAVCSRTVNTGNVTGSVCHLTSECTFSECCTEVSFLQRSFHTFLHIDPCNFVMVVGIETYSRNISLAGYHWGLYSRSVGIQNVQFSIGTFFNWFTNSKGPSMVNCLQIEHQCLHSHNAIYILKTVHTWATVHLEFHILYAGMQEHFWLAGIIRIE